MIQKAGCRLLTVHGRIRDQKGQLTGMADWSQIRAIKQALDIPIIANGNILYLHHISECIDQTGADAVMTAEGNLANPCLFTGKFYNAVAITKEYLHICKTIPHSAEPYMAKAHMFRMLHKMYLFLT